MDTVGTDVIRIEVIQPEGSQTQNIEIFSNLYQKTSKIRYIFYLMR